MFFFHFRVYRLHNNNCIVYHNTNCKHKCKQCDQIYSQTKKLHEHKSTDQRDRDSNGWNERGSPITEKQEHDQRYKEESFNQGVQYFIDGSVYKFRDIVVDLVAHSGGKVCFKFLKFFLYSIDHLACITSKVLFQYDGCRGVAVLVRVDVEKFTSKFNLSN